MGQKTCSLPLFALAYATKMQTHSANDGILSTSETAEKKPQICFDHVHNPLSTSEGGTFESIGVRSEREPHRSIAQFVEARAASLIAQFLAAQAGFDREQAVKREPHRSIAQLAVASANSRRLQDTCGGWDPAAVAESLTAHHRQTQKIEVPKSKNDRCMRLLKKKNPTQRLEKTVSSYFQQVLG